MTGEIPLRENEVEPFLQQLERANVGISAVVNHYILENPRLIFVHIEASGDSATIAGALRKAINATPAGFREETPSTGAVPSGLKKSTIMSAIGYNAMATSFDGVLTVMVNRQEQFSNCSLSIYQANGTSSTSGSGTTGTGSTGTAGSGSTGTSGTSSTGTSGTGATASSSTSGPGLTASNTCLMNAMSTAAGSSSGASGSSGAGTTGSTGTTSGTGSGTTTTSASGDTNFPSELGAHSMFRFEMAADSSVDVNAEFALLATEVQPTVRALREAGFKVSAIHNHFLNETPRLFFLHAYGQGSPAHLAQIIRQVLDQNAQASGTASTSGSGSGTTGTGTSGTGSSGNGSGTGTTGTGSTGSGSTGSGSGAGSGSTTGTTGGGL